MKLTFLQLGFRVSNFQILYESRVKEIFKFYKIKIFKFSQNLVLGFGHHRFIRLTPDLLAKLQEKSLSDDSPQVFVINPEQNYSSEASQARLAFDLKRNHTEIDLLDEQDWLRTAGNLGLDANQKTWLNEF